MPLFYMEIPELIKLLSFDFNELIIETLNEPEIKAEIIRLNQEEQLSKGIDSLGQKIETISSLEQNTGLPYARFTIRQRSLSGLQVENVDLKVTGEFWNTFEVKVTNEETEVLADFNKPDGDIRENFDNRFDFLGLTEKNLESLITWSSFLDILQKKLFSRLGL